MKKNFLKCLLLSIAIAFSFTLVGCGNTEPPAWASNYELPKAEQAYSNIVEIYGSEQAVFLLGGSSVLRMKCPKNGESVKINFTFEIPFYARMLFEDSVQEFNDVFKVINPNYKFEINYNPTASDLDEYYSVRVAKVQAFTSADTLGTAPHSLMGNGYIGNFGINIKESVLESGTQIMSVFKHELMHLLGAGDAYKNSNATKDTIMQGYNPNGNMSFSNTDVALLDAMYRNPDSPYSDEYIKNFIASYKQTNVHNLKNNQANVYRAMIDRLNVSELKNQIDELAYTTELKNAVKNKIGNKLTIDESFGSSSVNIGEVAYANPVEVETVYRYHAFEITNSSTKHTYSYKKYHNIMSSTSGGYTKVYPYGQGVVICDTQGNVDSVYMVRVGDYVLSLEKEGTFESLSTLGGRVNRIYMVTTLSDSGWFNLVGA